MIASRDFRDDKIKQDILTGELERALPFLANIEDIELIHQILKSRSEISQSVIELALVKMCSKSNPSGVKMLLDHSDTLTEKTSYLCFLSTVNNHQTEVLKVLLASDKVPFPKDSLDTFIVEFICREGLCEELKRLLESDTIKPSVINKECLLSAIEKSNFDCAKLIASQIGVEDMMIDLILNEGRVYRDVLICLLFTAGNHIDNDNRYPCDPKDYKKVEVSLIFAPPNSGPDYHHNKFKEIFKDKLEYRERMLQKNIISDKDERDADDLLDLF